MKSHSERFAELGLSLPGVPAPLAAYVPAVRAGDLVYTAGQLPTVDGELVAAGLVGAEVTLEQATECARVATLNGLAAVVDVAGGLDAIGRVVKATVFVAGDARFTEQPQVANGASELLEQIFGPAGRHARTAVGVASLPRNAPVEVELVVQTHSTPTVHPL
jgi:enamine deaminase RidA (YjgF/YER057c/UK114 family)